MPFLEGASPIRRTLQFLESGKLVFKDRVRVMSLNYTVDERTEVIKQSRIAHPINVDDPVVFKAHPWYVKTNPAHRGIQEFDYWNVPQIQYKNPGLQVVTFKNETPSPFITCYMKDGEQVYFDVDHQTSATILERIIQTLGKSEEILGEEALATEKKDNPANFGRNCGRFCMCVIDGQVPCPSLVPLPKHWRGKYHFGHKDINEVEE